MTEAEGRAALVAELEGELPDGLDVLDDEQLARLAMLLAAAKEQQSRDLRAGADEALRHVPRLLRGPFRKALGA